MSQGGASKTCPGGRTFPAQTEAGATDEQAHFGTVFAPSVRLSGDRRPSLLLEGPTFAATMQDTMPKESGTETEITVEEPEVQNSSVCHDHHTSQIEELETSETATLIDDDNVTSQETAVSTSVVPKPCCPGLGLFYAFCSCFFFSSAALCVKLISRHNPMNPLEITLVRHIITGLCILPAMIYLKVPILAKPGQRMILTLRGLAGATALCFSYYAIQHMPLADAAVVIFSSPIFTGIFGRLCLKERYGLFDILLTFVTFAGVVLIARPPFLFGGGDASYGSTEHLLATGSAFLTAMLSALAFIVMRKSSAGLGIHYLVQIMFLSIIGTIESVIVLAIMRGFTLPPCGIDRYYLIAVGLGGLIGQIFMTKSFLYEKAHAVAVVRTMDIVFAFIFQYLFLSNVPTWLSVGGAILVASGTVGLAIKKWYISSKANSNK
ncbi:SLC35G1 [Branchiostoma lanceolatum]|uniref:SLC35G1 protein n=1 Tax=Branchiostoma lanceolatum TaxID=7740 RepID=A0A8J9YS95_BRALA|nr:SLC35G1 [Branchiostoma lanceolatum]